jgi:hypothetical protein
VNRGNQAVTAKHAGRGRAGRLVACGCLLPLVSMLLPAAESDQPAMPGGWTIETVDGRRIEAGLLTAIDRDSLRCTPAAGEGETMTLGLAEVRVITRSSAEAGRTKKRTVRAITTDGDRIAGGDLRLEETVVSLLDPAGDEPVVVLPAESVSRVEWRTEGEGDEPAWVEQLPERPESDLIVIRKAADPEPVYQLVPCAIQSIDATRVTVSLEEDRIPVDRARVAGLVWVRPAAEPLVEGPVIDLAGGRIRCGEIGLAEDDSWLRASTRRGEFRIRLDHVLRIDVAAGRTRSLVGLPPAELRVEPYFGDLYRIDGLAAFFDPRPVSADDNVAEMVMQPKTFAAWDLPAGTRRFRGSFAAVREGTATPVSVEADGRPLAEFLVGDRDNGETAVDLELGEARRLGIRVDFPAAGHGGVRLIDPRLEK